MFISFATFGTDPYRPLVDVVKKHPVKPVFFSVLGDKDLLEACRTFLEKHQIPSYLFPEMAVRVFAHMRRYARKMKPA